MIELPVPVAILDSARHKVDAKLERLTPEQARERIDGLWWKKVPPEIRRPPLALDADWKWYGIVQEETASGFGEAVCIVTSDRQVQGAAVYRFDARSCLEAGQGSVFLEYLATAPWNRERLCREPRCRGVGLVLLKFVVRHSAKLGLKGRVGLASLNDPDTVNWYMKRGFVDTGEVIQEKDTALPLLELPVEGARKLLKDEP